MKIKKNIGKTDKIVRISLGLILGILSYFFTGPLALVILGLGIALIVTALTGFCGLYQIFGINTCEIKKKE